MNAVACLIEFAAVAFRRSAWPALAACATLGLMPLAAHAWGIEGHAMVADIADQYLSETARDNVKLLLRDDLGADGKPSGRTTLAQVASWPDEIRRTDIGKATAPWHYEDFPICGAPDMNRVCPNGQCAGVALNREIAILKDRNADPRARNEALKWIVHLVGDIHQPLHASDNDDRGGNDVKVSFLGQSKDGNYPLNLHAVWDTYLVRRVVEQAGGTQAFLDERPSEFVRRRWEISSVDDWMTESNSIGRDFIYPQLGSAFACNRKSTEVVALDEVYYDAAAPIVRLRLRQAGVRLAAVLNAALGRRE